MISGFTALEAWRKRASKSTASEELTFETGREHIFAKAREIRLAIEREKTEMQQKIDQLEEQNKELLIQLGLKATVYTRPSSSVSVAQVSDVLKSNPHQELVEAIFQNTKIGRAVQQECRDRSRMPSSA
eukprot:TRINITY_DN40379_c0_g1_i1.p1 TRINITY_DN40379_c0_g1~~TRINITY_DN40379_c0_g1_i1.p1  ORF type:complete len:129 (-),score=16.00 TRINITY_DN40379_c0_g1_i1:11-397(-)